MLFGGAVWIGHELCAPIGSGKFPVDVKPCRAFNGTRREGPLLRAETIDQCMADTGQIQVATLSQLFVFVKDLSGIIKFKQAGLAGTQVFFQALCEIYGDCPVRPRLTRCDDCLAYVGNAPLGVGHATFLFPPTGGGQQKVGELRGFSGAEGFLQHHERAGLQGCAHGCLVRHGLRGVGTGDPQRLDLAVAHLLEQFDRGEPGIFRQLLDAPVGCHLRTVLRIGGVTVAGQQVGQTAGFPPAHGIWLTGEGERSGAGTTDLPGGQVQIDQCTVFRAAGGGLVKPHAPQRQKAR
ncbi:hypothetical protein D3C86_833500 [compost metagenome]